MTSYLRGLAIIAFMTTGATLTAAQTSGSGTTTRYWDCCKPSCAWNDLSTLGIQSAVKTCDVNDKPITDTTAASGCNGGTAYMCSDQSPWIAGTDLAYGFASVSASGSNCCQCYQLTFTSGAVAGKTMIVQATNTGTDVGRTQFDIAMPGGGFGIYDGCSKAWGATKDVWGAQYGGSSTDTCSSFPDALKAGCKFRWDQDFFAGSDNPTVNWEKVSCPAAITAKSGCVRIGDGPAANNLPSTPSAAPSSATTAPSSTLAVSSGSTLSSSLPATAGTTAEASPSSSSTESAVFSSNTASSTELTTPSITAGTSPFASSTEPPAYTSLTGFVTSTVSSSVAAVGTSSSTISSYEYSSVSTIETSSTATSTYVYSSSTAVETASTTTSTYGSSLSTAAQTSSSATSTDVYSSSAAAETSPGTTSTSAYSSVATDQSSSSAILSNNYQTPVAASADAPAKIAQPEMDDDTCER